MNSGFLLMGAFLKRCTVLTDKLIKRFFLGLIDSFYPGDFLVRYSMSNLLIKFSVRTVERFKYAPVCESR